ELSLPALDAEADLAPIVPDELAAQAAEALPATEPAGAAQAGWSEALASLRDPLPIEEPAPATDLEDEATYYAATVGEQATAVWGHLCASLAYLAGGARAAAAHAATTNIARGYLGRGRRRLARNCYRLASRAATPSPTPRRPYSSRNA
nr:hypothetical protein [Tanacetum cinerariifolium]